MERKVVFIGMSIAINICSNPTPHMFRLKPFAITTTKKNNFFVNTI